MKSRTFVLSLACGISASLWAVPPRARPLPPAQTAGSSVGFTADKGKFRIMQGGNELGTEQFDLSPSGDNWIAKGEATLHIPGGGEARSTGQLRVGADGTPQRYDWSAGTDKKAFGLVTFQDGVAKSTINLPGKEEPLNQDFKFASPRAAILDNNLYDQYAIVGRLYDWAAKGVQHFPVLIPQDLTPGTIDVEAIGSQPGENSKFEVLRVKTSDLEIQLFFDAKHHLMRLEVPAARVVIVRQ